MTVHKSFNQKTKSSIPCPLTGLIVNLKNHEKADLVNGNLSKIGDSKTPE
jgi:hypothetical protein